MMTTRILSATALAAMLAPMLVLAACSTPPTAQVVRFHTAQPMARGTVHIAPADPAIANSLEFRVQADAVAGELRRNGFVVVDDPAKAQMVAMVEIQTASRSGPPPRSRMTIGFGGGFSSGNVGIGSSVQVPVGGTQQPTGLTSTTLTVSIRDKSTNQAVWEGRATADTGSGGGTAAAVPLASALFRDFPGPSGQSVQVPL